MASDQPYLNTIDYDVFKALYDYTRAGSNSQNGDGEPLWCITSDRVHEMVGGKWSIEEIESTFDDWDNTNFGETYCFTCWSQYGELCVFSRDEVGRVLRLNRPDKAKREPTGTQTARKATRHVTRLAYSPAEAAAECARIDATLTLTRRSKAALKANVSRRIVEEA